MESVAGLLSLDKRDEITRYAASFLKARGETERGMSALHGWQRPGQTGTDGMILDGSSEQDYKRSFSGLLEMIDREQDEYRGDLQ